MVCGHRGKKLTALDGKTLKILWTASNMDSFSYGPLYPCVPTIWKKTVLYGDRSGLYLVSLRTGDEKRLTTIAVGWGPMTLAGDILYFTELGGPIVAYDLQKNQILWKSNRSGDVSTLTIDAKSRRLFASISESPVVFNLDSGQEINWGDGRVPMQFFPTIYDNLVFSGSTDHHFYMRDRETGRIVYSYYFGQPVTAAVVVSSGIAVVAGADGRVVGIDVERKKDIWTFRSRNQFRSSPAIGGDTVYVADNSDKLYALDLFDGHLIWEFKIVGGIQSDISFSGRYLGLISSTQDLYLIGQSPSRH